MIYTVTCNPAVDYVMHFSDLIPGEVNRSEHEQIHWGGKGINISAVLRRLGAETAVLGFIAGFTGDALEQGLQKEGLFTDLIRLPNGNTRINVKIKSGRETDLNAAGPRIPADAAAELLRKLGRLTPQDILCVSGNLPASLPEEYLARMANIARRRGAQCVIDTSGKALREAVALRPFLIKPNKAETEEFFESSLRTEEDLKHAADRFRECGAQNVLISLGGDGAFLATSDGKYLRAGAPKGTVIDTVGAGDSMVAGFLAEYARTQNPSEALRTAIAAGSATAFCEGLAETEKIARIRDSVAVRAIFF